MTTTLFDNLSATPDRPPLAERMRPRSLEEVVGQEQILSGNGVLPALLKSARPPSLILWGPPGCGKTTIARIIAAALEREPVCISAVTSGVKDLKEIVERSRESLASGRPATLLFVDEIHRFNKAQQDAFLGPVEDGTLILVGATTENPSFELNAALLSRCRVLTLQTLEKEHLATLLERALTDRERGLGVLELVLDDAAKAWLVDRADGDARALLTDLEWVAIGCEQQGVPAADLALVSRILARKAPRYDATGEEHYNVISALHKSIRGSDVQAALYWLARMIEGGEDPLYIARRLVRIASEDVGAADPQALPITVAAREAMHFIGLPEGALALAEAVVYLATAPKSDRVYRAYSAAVEAVRATGTLPVPLAIRNAPTTLLKDLGYGKGYVTPHESSAGHRIQFLPDALKTRVFYDPKEIGFEREIVKRMKYFEALRSGKPDPTDG